MNNNLLIFFIFWGVWILVPVAIDGIYILTHIGTILLRGQKSKSQFYKIPKDKISLVSVIIPTYNEEKNVDECLNFLKTQIYPHQKLEIIIVDNGSSDRTGAIVREHIKENTTRSLPNNNFRAINHNGKTYALKNSFKKIKLLTYHRQNKAHALNIGLDNASGEIIMNIDCRSQLAPEAIYNMVAKFIHEPDLGACTGNIEISWQRSQLNGQSGRARFNPNGQIKQQEATLKQDFLAKCQFLEYLSSFRIGREFHAINNSIYTLSGAFSAFRASALGKKRFYFKDKQDYLKKQEKAWYSDRTVTEDTDLTLSLQDRHIKVGYAPYAKTYLKPVTSWQQLYAQRVRWRRGQIEVL